MQKVLIVDDSEAVRLRVRECLPPDEFDVLEAFDGVNALEKLESESNIGLVFLDVNMPRLDGVSMLEHLHISGTHRNVSIVVLTTEGQASLVERAKRAGAKGWLVKPFRPEVILKTARAVFSRVSRGSHEP